MARSKRPVFEFVSDESSFDGEFEAACTLCYWEPLPGLSLSTAVFGTVKDWPLADDEVFATVDELPSL